MHRRRFILGALSAVAIGRSLPGTAAAETAVASDFFLFDPRFTRARRAALDADPWNQAVAVSGDVTEFWSQQLSRTIGRNPLVVEGVTTESAVFCLDILARERASTHVTVHRIDRDLHHWTLRIAGAAT